MLAEKLLAHKYLGDYSRVDKPQAYKYSRANQRLAALEVLEEEAWNSEAAYTVMGEKAMELREQGADSVWEGQDRKTNAMLFTRLGWAAWAFGKRLATMVGGWAWSGARFLGRTLLSFLVRGILMPVGAAVISVLGWPVTLALALGGAATYLIYKVYGTDKAKEQSIKTRYSAMLQTGTARPTKQQTFMGGGVLPTDQQVVTTRAQQQQALDRKASGGTAPTPQGHGVKQFIASIDPQLIEIGKANSFVADAGVDLVGMNQDFMTIFYAMVGDWVQQGGSKVRINSGYRDIAKQKRLYDAWIARGKTGGAVARPGRSRHQRGLALDIASVSANGMARKGLLQKYKFIRPVRGEPWHLENLLFGSGAATAKAVEEAKQAKAFADAPTKIKAADQEWLDRMNKNPEAIAATDYPDQAKEHPDVYYQGDRPLTYREIYNRYGLELEEQKVDAKPREVEVPKKRERPEVVPQEHAEASSIGEESRQDTWIKSKGKIIRG